MTKPGDPAEAGGDSALVLTGTRGFAAGPTERVRGRDLAVCFVLAAAVDLVVGGRMLPGVLAGGLVNPDSYMRLVRLDDILQKGAVLDSVFRDGSGRGTVLHWSHLVDSLLLLMALPLRAFMPWPAALHAVAAAFGPLSIGALGAACAWAAAPLARRGFLFLAPLAAALAPAIAGYGIAGVLHHHVALMVAVTVLGGWTLRAVLWAPRGAGLAMGAWSAVGIWFTPEAMPFILMGFGIVWIAWLEGGRGAGAVRGAGFGFLAAALLVFAVDPPRPERWVAVPDRMSVVHLAMAGATALAALFTFVIDRLPVRGVARLALGSALGAACVGGWIALFPGLLRGAEGLLDEATAALFFRGISEMQPVRGVADSLTYLSGGAAAGLAILWLGRRSLAGLAAGVAALLLVVFSVQHVRFASYPACLAAALLPVLLTRISDRLAERAQWAALARVGTLAWFVLVPQLGSAMAVRRAEPPVGTPGAACPVAAAVPLLAPLAGRVVLSDVNDVPEILYRTGVLTVGSLYHRSPENFLRLRAAWRSDPARGDAARAAGAEFVLFCARPRKGSIVADLPEGTLYDVLAAGRPPGWLREAGRSAAGHVLYEVTP